MTSRNRLVVFILFLSSIATPGFAQIYWSNQSPSGLSDDVWCVTYGDGTFAATTSQGKVLTSTDGLTWSSQTVAQGTWLVSIAYGNGKWVAVGAGGAILVSSDLQTWISPTAVTSNKLNGVLFNGAMWAAVGEADTIITSPDAITWTVQPVPATLGLSGFLHGITWDSVNNVFLISGSDTGDDTPPYGGYSGGMMLQLSPTGSPAISETLPVQADPLEAVQYEAGLTPNTVAVGDGGIVLSGSYNGGSGPVYSTVPSVNYRGLTYGNGYWVAAGDQGTLLSSVDGINWTQRFSGNSPSALSTSTLLSAAYSETLQRFVATGTGGTILASSSTPTVFGNVSTRGYVSSSQTFIGGFVIEGTAPRTVLIRADGPVLSTFNVSGPLPDPVLTVFNSSGAVVATNTGWGTNTSPTSISTAALEVGAFALPSGSADSALLITLQPGAYTAQVTSAKGNSGIALFEAYTH
jgi:hypothetical protein